MLQQRKKHVVLASLANFMSAYKTFFYLKPSLKQLQGNLQTMAENSVVRSSWRRGIPS